MLTLGSAATPSDLKAQYWLHWLHWSTQDALDSLIEYLRVDLQGMTENRKLGYEWLASGIGKAESAAKAVKAGSTVSG